uniref:Heme utilization protein HuvX n=1 Tax=Cyanothece sp. (strain PCC 7425 / ATCC 29141) TaxID=395961 RepID=B8HKC3_CYAP4
MTTLPEFLQACETLGLLRLIVTNDVAVLEVRAPLAKVFYAELPKTTETGTLIQHYANMHTEDFEFHLNMDKIHAVKFETGQAKRGNFTTYAIRFLTDAGKPALSAFLQWGKPGEYAPGQVEAWQALKEKYGEIWEL